MPENKDKQADKHTGAIRNVLGSETLDKVVNVLATASLKTTRHDIPLWRPFTGYLCVQKWSLFHQEVHIISKILIREIRFAGLSCFKNLLWEFHILGLSEGVVHRRFRCHFHHYFHNAEQMDKWWELLATSTEIWAEMIENSAWQKQQSNLISREW